MENNNYPIQKSYTKAYVKALWVALKTKQRRMLAIILTLIGLVDFTCAALRDFDSSLNNFSEQSVIGDVYPLLLIVCCVMASFGMDASDQVSNHKVSALQEWGIRWAIFVLFPFLFFLVSAHLIDGLFATPLYQPAPWEVTLACFPRSYTLPIFFFSTSFFFLMSTLFSLYAFSVGAGILSGISITLYFFLPKEVFYFNDMYQHSNSVILFLISMAVLSLVGSYIKIRLLKINKTTKEVQ
ncbi:hypothetical protein [Prevotella aurantiaca]